MGSNVKRRHYRRTAQPTQTARTQGSQVKQPEVLLGHRIPEHVNQAAAIGQESHPFTFALHLDVRQLGRRTIRVYCEERREREYFCSAIYYRVPASRPPRIQEWPRCNPNGPPAVNG